MKYYICSLIEKLHRHCFDIIYVQDHIDTFKDRILLRILDISQKIFSDYRSYLKKESRNMMIKYQRYSESMESRNLK